MKDRLDGYFDGLEPTDLDLELIRILTNETRWERFKRRMRRRPFVEVQAWERPKR